MNKREQGGVGEEIAKAHYESLGFTCLEQNYTIRGGEIDLVMKKNAGLTFVEVKSVDHVDSIHNYITATKIRNLLKTINVYLRSQKYTETTPYYVDVVFVRHNKIFEVYNNVTQFL